MIVIPCLAADANLMNRIRPAQDHRDIVRYAWRGNPIFCTFACGMYSILSQAVAPRPPRAVEIARIKLQVQQKTPVRVLHRRAGHLGGSTIDSPWILVGTLHELSIGSLVRAMPQVA